MYGNCNNLYNVCQPLMIHSRWCLTCVRACVCACVRVFVCVSRVVNRPGSKSCGCFIALLSGCGPPPLLCKGPANGMTLLGFMVLSGTHFISGAGGVSECLWACSWRRNAVWNQETPNDNKEKLENTLPVCFFVCVFSFVHFFFRFTFWTLKGSSSNNTVYCSRGLCYKVNPSEPQWPR